MATEDNADFKYNPGLSFIVVVVKFIWFLRDDCCIHVTPMLLGGYRE
jgi:hypothetical protein